VGGCSSTGTTSSKPDAGNRLFVEGSFEALSSQNEWILIPDQVINDDDEEEVEEVGGTEGGWLYLNASSLPADGEVVLSALSTLIYISDNAEDISISGFGLTDSDYTSLGYQLNFNMDAMDGIGMSYHGFPADAAVQLNSCHQVTIENCRFSQLGGGGVRAYNSTSYLNITASNFTHIGESAILLTGNATTQTSHCWISNNRISNIGESLVSCGGVILSTAVDVTISNNHIWDVPRWGIHVRSNLVNGEEALSLRTIIENNTIQRTGLGTKEYGGMTVVAQSAAPIANSTIRFNCVCDTTGVFSKVVAYANDDDIAGTYGVLYGPYYSFGFHLDNDASGYLIEHNLVQGAGKAGIRVHNGRNNTFRNNLVINGTSSQYGDTQLSIATDSNTKDNAFYNNIITWGKGTAKYKLWYGTTNVSILTAFPPQLVNSNTYWYWYGSDAVIDQKTLTMDGDWAAWTERRGFDQQSTIDQYPQFVNPNEGNYCLEETSPALNSGFEPMSDWMCNGCCSRDYS